MSAQIYNNAVNWQQSGETETTHRRDEKAPRGQVPWKIVLPIILGSILFVGLFILLLVKLNDNRVKVKV